MAANNTYTNSHWYGFLLASGAASVAVEITGLRLLAPLFGSSLPVWGAVIALVIGGLAVGYALGGKQASAAVTESFVMRHAAVAAALFLALPAMFALALQLRNAFFDGGSIFLLIGAFLLSFASLLPSTILFGMVSPLAVQVETKRRQQEPGQSAGRIFTLTTTGSLLGILIPSFITIPFLGTRETIWLFAGAVLLLTAPALTRLGTGRIKLALFIALMALASFTPHPLGHNVIFADETPYQHVTVREAAGTRLLTFDANIGIQSLWTPSSYTGGYWDYAGALPLLLPNQTETKVLVLGSAGASTERQMAYFWEGLRTFSFTSVDIDGALTDIANTYFEPPDRTSVTADARTFVAADRNTYDIIVIDTYARELTVPFYLTTKDFFTELKPRLAPQGILAINLNAQTPHEALVQSVAGTLHTTFPHIGLISVPTSCNRLLIASTEPIKNVTDTDPAWPRLIEPMLPAFKELTEPTYDQGTLLTDNRAPTEWLGLAALFTSSQADNACG